MPLTPLAVLLSAVAVAAAPPSPGIRPVALPEAGFEGSTAGAAPRGWTLSVTEGVRAVVEPAARSEGALGLTLEAPAAGGQARATSGSVRLKVGQLYRLTATARTAGVHADALARYPTALGACIAMRSFPFTNCSPPARADGESHLEVVFFATEPEDAVELVLGRNGRARGRIAFDDVRLEELDDLGAYLSLDAVRWSGKGFRYDDGGWIFVHIEGEPYVRGRQYGQLVAPELGRFLEKNAINRNRADPEKGWLELRRLTDALFLRRFEVEYLEEMRGIADGAAAAGITWKGRPVDLLDIATLNSAVDISSLDDGLRVAATPLTGRSFLQAEEELTTADRDHCSSFVATHSATRSGRFVMGQLFMWNGYTGIHWDVMLDVVPTKGHRLVMQTFPGGIHSGSDWYLNSAGLVIGETTVAQSPFDPQGAPQSSRIRKAAQYASSIDEIAAILKKSNNGLYTNDWTIADAKTDEGADFLLGTRASRLWRTGARGNRADTPGNLVDFIWANNNARDPAVRRELASPQDEAPSDTTLVTWNRDIAFQQFYREHGRGDIDLAAGVQLLASSPINRPHACDGKLTTSEMAERLVFLAHYGKTTLREKWVGSRFIADLPGATPHLTLGYTTFSPIFVSEHLQRLHAEAEAAHGNAGKPAPGGPGAAEASRPKPDLSALEPWLAYDEKLLWKGTVFGATDADAWFTSGSAAYHALLARLPAGGGEKAREHLRAGLEDAASRLAWVTLREGAAAPVSLTPAWDRYGPYQIPRVRGTFVLHQLRLHLGNERFARAMRTVQRRYAGKSATTAQLCAALSLGAGEDVTSLVRPWLERADLPAPELTASAVPAAEGWTVTVRLSQQGAPWPFHASLAVRQEDGSVRWATVAASGPETRVTVPVARTPVEVTLGPDLPVAREHPFVMSNLFDDFAGALIAWPSSRQVEAGHTLGLVFRDTLADAFVETLPPLVPDAEVSETDLATHDLVLLGGAADNALVARLAREGRLPVELGRGSFRWQGETYAAADDGYVLAMANPWNPERGLYLFSANSRLELWQLVKSWPREAQGWARWKGAELVAKGHLVPARMTARVSVPAANP